MRNCDNRHHVHACTVVSSLRLSSSPTTPTTSCELIEPIPTGERAPTDHTLSLHTTSDSLLRHLTFRRSVYVPFRPPRRVASSSTPKPPSSTHKTASPGPATPSKSKSNNKTTSVETPSSSSSSTHPFHASAVTAKRPSSSSTSSSTPSSLANSATNLWNNYNLNTSPKLKLLDGFQLFLMLSGIAQFLYCLVITTFPFNAFISGFAATVGQFVLTAALRAQVNPKNKSIFPTISPERAFADYVFGSALLHFFVYNYLG